MWFIKEAINPETRVYYFSAVITVLISIVLHELAHGWAAIRQGDDTPIRLKRLTGNPFVHMGPFSIAAVFLIGIGWGAMPVDPSRFRSKYGDAIVAAAGPAMNVLLAIMGMTAYVLTIKYMDRTGDEEDALRMQTNLLTFLQVFGLFNIALAIFNLAPVPPLDGSHILGNFHMGFKHWMQDHAEHQPIMFMGYFVLIGSLNETPYGLWNIAATVSNWYTVTLIQWIV